MLQIQKIEKDPIHYFPYKVVAARHQDDGGYRQLQDTLFPVWKGVIDNLPKDLDAIIVASDLQGHCEVNGALVLLGEVLPEELKLLLEIQYPDIAPDRTGVFLCGDLFALTHRRGGMGDVQHIWKAFADTFKWVAGVAGNHDMIGQNNKDVKTLQYAKNSYYLDNGIAKIDGMQIAGLGGIIGSPKKHNRREESDYLKQLKKLLLKKPDVLLLHEGPDFPEANFIGTELIREMLERSPSTLVCCGHTHWDIPLKTLSNATQVLNMEGRAIILGKK